MHASPTDLSPEVMPGYEGRMTDWGEWRIAFERFGPGFPEDPAPFFRGLPDDRCQCEHLGYVVRGSFRVTYLDGTEETVREGEAYRLEPGHLVYPQGELEVLEFSPRHEHDRTMEQVARNVQALMATS